MNKRLAEIILILLKYDDFITIDLIAEALKVSNRTIRNDLKILDSLLPDMGLSILKKTGMGILLEGKASDKLKVYDTFKHTKIEQSIDTPIDRHHYIILKLTTVKYYRIFEFVDELFVSRATIHKDLVAIEEILEKFNITLERSNTLGLSLSGKERDIRNLMFDICASTGSSAFASIIKNKEKACSGQFIYQGLDLTDDEINHFIAVSKIKYVSSFTNLSLEALSQIAILLLISLIRNQSGNEITFSNEFISELLEKPYIKESNFLLSNISKAYHLELYPSEVYYIQIHLLAYQLNPDSINYDDIESFTLDLIQSWSKYFNLPLDQDETLRKMLITHMIPVHTRILHEISVENDLMHEIHQRYPNTFKVVQDTIQTFPFWKDMRDEDIGFIALHLAAALERNKQTLKTLLVHGTSLGAQLLLKSKINNNLAEIEIVKEVNIAEFHNEMALDYDLIISTVQLSTNVKPNIIINNIITDNDIIRLKNYIMPLVKNKNNPRESV